MTNVLPVTPQLRKSFRLLSESDIWEWDVVLLLVFVRCNHNVGRFYFSIPLVLLEALVTVSHYKFRWLSWFWFCNTLWLHLTCTLQIRCDCTKRRNIPINWRIRANYWSKSESEERIKLSTKKIWQLKWQQELSKCTNLVRLINLFFKAGKRHDYVLNIFRHEKNYIPIYNCWITP